MGTSLSSIHIFSRLAPADHGFHFQSFSPSWQTCTDDFSEKEPHNPDKAAQLISRYTDAPVLRFGVFDSDMIWFTLYRYGKVIASYCDDELVANKKLYDIPSLIGYGDGHKKRLSSILACSDVDMKIQMLEEYFGVCLLFVPELMNEPETLFRERTDTVYRKYIEEEKKLSGKAALIGVNLIAEYPGKLFWDFFDSNLFQRMKPHCFLYGYANENADALVPVQFTGKTLEMLELSTFMCDRIRRTYEDPRFKIEHGTPSTVTFSDDCPPAYAGKNMRLPVGFYPEAFTLSGELLLQGNHRLYVVDETLKVIAKLSIKGDIADVLEDHILTASGDSFCGYCYDPKAKIYIYELIKRGTPHSIEKEQKHGTL